jgi:putative endonuclease
MKKAHHLHIGKVGEDVAVQWLVKNGFTVVERNYWKKWGEIDIVAEKDTCLHFVEVKTTERTSDKNSSVAPEENMHQKKMQRLERVIETYVQEKQISESKEWSIDVCVVYLNTKTHIARVQYYQDIVLK